ncbi:MAG: hypothetical protein WCP57_11885 [Bacteroidota bacterium]
MKKVLLSIFILSIVFIISSCEKDEGKLPTISFKTGSGYTSTSSSITKGSNFMIGINAAKSEEADVLKKFNISKSINGATAVSVYNADLTGADADAFSYDYSITNDTVVGQQNKYIFTVTNRDGLTNQVDLTVTVQ